MVQRAGGHDWKAGNRVDGVADGLVATTAEGAFVAAVGGRGSLFFG
jgi:hypothetical protein